MMRVAVGVVLSRSASMSHSQRLSPTCTQECAASMHACVQALILGGGSLRSARMTHLAVGCLQAFVGLLEGLIAFLHVLIANRPLLLLLMLTPVLTIVL